MTIDLARVPMSEHANGGPPKELAAKIVKIMRGITRVEKRGRNAQQNYDYVTEADVLDAFRPLLVEHGVAVLPSVESHTSEIIGETRNKSPVTREAVMVAYTLVDAESGASWTVRFPGVCHEPGGDKGVYKAITGATKYFVLKTFQVSSGDDPEAHDGGASQYAEPARAHGRRPTDRTVTDAQLLELNTLATSDYVSDEVKASVRDHFERDAWTSERAGRALATMRQQIADAEAAR